MSMQYGEVGLGTSLVLGTGISVGELGPSGPHDISLRHTGQMVAGTVVGMAARARGQPALRLAWSLDSNKHDKKV